MSLPDVTKCCFVTSGRQLGDFKRQNLDCLLNHTKNCRTTVITNYISIIFQSPVFYITLA